MRISAYEHRPAAIQKEAQETYLLLYVNSIQMSFLKEYFSNICTLEPKFRKGFQNFISLFYISCKRSYHKIVVNKTKTLTPI